MNPSNSLFFSEFPLKMGFVNYYSRSIFDPTQPVPEFFRADPARPDPKSLGKWTDPTRPDPRGQQITRPDPWVKNF